VYFTTKVDRITLAVTMVPSEWLVAPYGRFRVFLIQCYLKSCDRKSSTGAQFVNRRREREIHYHIHKPPLLQADQCNPSSPPTFEDTF
jgi:hypothetical protein